MGAKLHEVLAVEKDLSTTSKRLIQESIRTFGKENLFKNVGFGINFRHYDSYLWESTFYDGIIPARDLLDAQITYNLNNLSIKLGGSNITNNEYVSSPGSGLIGSTYYIGLTFQP